jgi:hypothetical protein
MEKSREETLEKVVNLCKVEQIQEKKEVSNVIDLSKRKTPKKSKEELMPHEVLKLKMSKEKNNHIDFSKFRKNYVIVQMN